MDLSQCDIPHGAKLSYVHQLMYFDKGVTYHLEVHQYSNSEFIGYIESSNDSMRQYPPATASSLQQCVQQLLATLASMADDHMIV